MAALPASDLVVSIATSLSAREAFPQGALNYVS
jgi:hypothetical protein